MYFISTFQTFLNWKYIKQTLTYAEFSKGFTTLVERSSMRKEETAQGDNKARRP
jgi:hypothetical protein